MGGVVYLGQVLEIEVGVDLSRADIGVPEKLLDPPQIAAGLEQVRREGVAEHVRMDVYAETLPARPQVHAQLHGARREPPAAAPHEHRALAGARAGLRIRG